MKDCVRRGCDCPLCTTFIEGIGYLCEECQEEFKGYLVVAKANPSNEPEIKKALENFMNSGKGAFVKHIPITVDKFFQKHKSS